MKGKKNMKKQGFTLAEVLITLVIIGVIAAMAIPTVMNNTNAQEYKTAFKKAIETMNSGLQMEYATEGLTAQDFTGPEQLVTMFKRRLNVMDQQNIAWPKPDSKTGKTGTDCSGTIFSTQDGMIFCVVSFEGLSAEGNDGTKCDSYNEHPCGTAPNLYIDVNGAKGPNIMTTQSSRPRDQYQATIYAQKVVPYGDAAQEVMYDKPEQSTASSTGK